ncbi:iron-containing alcohol dehydrogenase [Firmicutes bacterium CAG:345]|nr:iron-containing alcohol dehydrogenase [Firmicutes bacterium CAG:345]
MKENTIVKDEESLIDLLNRVKAAQKEFSTFSQEKVDEIFYRAALAANAQRIPLAKMAVEETGMGIVEDKVIKNHFAAEYIYNHYKNVKTCDEIERNDDMGFIKVAEPIGVLAAIVPTTNPTSTAIFKALIALKTRNGLIFSPHPRAKKCTIAAAKIVLDAAVKAGAPEDIIGWIDEPSIQLSNMLMTSCDCILATGGPGMVKAAYSSGKPAIGVGPGNTPIIVDSTANIELAASSVIQSKCFDNGMICASEQSVIVLSDIYSAFKAELIKRGAYFLSKADTKKVGETIIINGSVNAKIVGQRPVTIAKMAGVEIPEASRIMVGEVERVELSEPFAHEKLSPVLAMYKAKTFEEAVDKAEKLVTDGGYGHTSGIYVDEIVGKEKIDVLSKRMKTCRILVNTPAAQGGIGDLYNFMLNPSLTLGCGSWGGNSVSENVTIKHLLNIKVVAERRNNMLWLRLPEKVYFKPGCLHEALTELGTEYHRKRVFIVTDSFLYQSGFTKRITKILDEQGIEHMTFFQVAPDPTLACAKLGASQMADFKPDAIIAIGGGSPMDAAKIMWVLYEHPEIDFRDMALDFMDIRKRVYKFPHMGSKAMLVAIPTTAGTGSEVTPFAIITDQDDGTKYPVTDYELLPDMAIIDSDLMLNIPRGLTKASGIDALVHSIEAIASIMSSPYTDAMANEAIKLIFKYLPRAYKNGASDPEAREGMANAATIAGISFANAFLGICHSMGHKLGSYHHIPHGIAVSLVLENVMKFNACDAPTKMGTFPQYDHPVSLHRYAEAARGIGITGKNDEEIFNKFLEAIHQLKVECDIPLTIQEFGVPEDQFLQSLDQMSEDAFNDQCTAANPRYPLISEIKELYLKSYYGK